MPIAQINGTSIHYRTDGAPTLPSLILSNSLGTDLGMWDSQAPALARHFHVVRYDTRGHGGSASPPGPYDLRQLGADVLALMDHLEIERAHFCGLSMGGVTGQWLGIHARTRVDKLVLANTAARVGTAEGWISRAVAVRAHGLANIAESAASRWFSAAWAAMQHDTVARLTATLRQQDAEGYASCCDALALADLRGALNAMTAQTLIIAGELDPVTTLIDAEAMRAEIPQAHIAVLPASHISNIEAASQFTRVLKAFLLA